jgi:hypothetical protein
MRGFIAGLWIMVRLKYGIKSLQLRSMKYEQLAHCVRGVISALSAPVARTVSTVTRSVLCVVRRHRKQVVVAATMIYIFATCNNRVCVLP